MAAGEGRGGKVRRWALRVALALGVLGVGTWAAFQLSPWPSVLLIRWREWMAAEYNRRWL